MFNFVCGGVTALVLDKYGLPMATTLLNYYSQWNGRLVAQISGHQKVTSLANNQLNKPGQNDPKANKASEIKPLENNFSSAWEEWSIFYDEFKATTENNDLLNEFVLELLAEHKSGTENALWKILINVDSIRYISPSPPISAWSMNNSLFLKDECTKKLWNSKEQLLLRSKNLTVTQNSPIRQKLFRIYELFTNYDSAKNIVYSRVYSNNPENQSKAKTLYFEAISAYLIRQKAFAKLLNIPCNPSALNRLAQENSTFEMKKFTSPFAQKQPLGDYFTSQNIAGVPTGLSEVVLTIAACYDETYKEEMNKLGLHPERGIILHGAPGTGKTVMAKALAEYVGCSASRIKITSGSNLLDKWLGGTEKGIRELFADAKKDPKNLHVIIIDEIESILAKRANAQLSHEVSRVTQFLTELDGIDSPKNTFVIGITNYVDQLDPAAIRPGRLGNLIEVSLPDEEQRAKIYEIYLRKIDKEFLPLDYKELAKKLAAASAGYSGAEIKAATQRTSNDAFMKMIRVRHFDREGASASPKITEEDFLASIALINTQQRAVK